MKLVWILWLSHVLPQPAADSLCLSTTVYLEARDQTLRGQQAVAEVALRRLDSGLWGDSMCGGHCTQAIRADDRGAVHAAEERRCLEQGFGRGTGGAAQLGIAGWPTQRNRAGRQPLCRQRNREP